MTNLKNVEIHKVFEGTLRPLADDEILQCAQTFALEQAYQHAGALQDGYIRIVAYRAKAAEAWLTTNRADGKHEGCPNPAHCLANYDQGVMAVRNGGAVVVAHFVIDEDLET